MWLRWKCVGLSFLDPVLNVLFNAPLAWDWGCRFRQIWGRYIAEENCTIAWLLLACSLAANLRRFKLRDRSDAVDLVAAGNWEDCTGSGHNKLHDWWPDVINWDIREPEIWSRLTGQYGHYGVSESEDFFVVNYFFYLKRY